MHSNNQINISLGIHLKEDVFSVAYYGNHMPEAEVIVNPDTGSDVWRLDIGNEEENWALAYKNSLQKHIDRIFQIINENVVYITFSVPDLSESLVYELLPVLDSLQLNGAVYSLQDDNESYYDFVTFQNRDLWANEVVLFEQVDSKLRARSLVMAAFPHEKALTVKETEFNDFDFGGENETTDILFCGLLEEFFNKRVVSSVFLQGETFGKNWMKQTLKFLCKNRRVFGVSDIIVKGACYRGFRINYGELKSKYYMGRHQLPFNVSMTVTEDGREEICRLVRAGTNWYDADFMWHFMVNDIDTLHFRTDPAITGLQRYIDVDISKIPHRPKFATKVEISIHFASLDRWYIKVCDLGLGELYPSDHIEEIAYIGQW